MRLKMVKCLTLLIILLISFCGCTINQPTSDDEVSGSDIEIVHPGVLDGDGEVIFNVTDEALYNKYNSESLPTVIERVSSSVVQVIIEVSGVLNSYSGVVIGNSSDYRYSYIVICHHSIIGATKVDVCTYVDGQLTILNASPVGTDPQTNLCVIRVEENLETALFYSATSTAIKPGESVITVANSLATEKVVSSLGIVSATNYVLNVGEGKINSYMLTDAFVNANSAGGGVFTAQGGFLTGIIDNTAGGKNGKWNGYVIPADVVQDVCAKIIQDGVVLGRYKLGVQVVDNLTAWGVNESIVVTSVSQDGSIYAGGAGLRVGDVIMGVSYAQTGDVYLTTANDFYEYLYNVCNFKVGDKLTFFIQRNNTNDSITVTITQYNYFERVA